MATTMLPDTLNKKKVDPYGVQTGVQPQAATAQAAQPQMYSQVPYMQDNNQNQLIPLSPDAVKQGEVKQAASTAAMQQPQQTTTGQMVQQQTQQLLRDPYQGLDVTGYKQTVMDKLNRDLAQSAEAARQQLGATSQSGELRNEFLKNALIGAQIRSDTEAQTDYDLSALKQQRMIDALATGRAGMTSEQSAANDYINRLATASGLYEPGLQRQADIESQLRAQQYQTGERLGTQAYQTGEREATQQYQSAERQAQQAYQTAERLGTQAWSTDERLGEQDFSAIQANYDREMQQAIANQDDKRIRELQDASDKLALKMQTNDMTHDQSMAYLTAELENAKANSDYTREKNILAYQATLQAKENERNYNYDYSLTQLQGGINKEIAAGNNENAIALQKAELEYRVNHDIEEKALEQARIDLQKTGIDLEAFDKRVEYLTMSVGEEAAQEYIYNTLAEEGVDVSQYNIADKKQAAMKAMTDEFEMIQSQFAMSHANNPELVQDGVLTPEGLKKFDEYYNFTMYGELTPEQQEERDNAGVLGASDLLTALPGDKFKIDDPYQISFNDSEGRTITGDTIPPGNYAIKVKTDSQGSKLFGDYQDADMYYLVGEDGQEHLLRIDYSSKKGYF